MGSTQHTEHSTFWGLYRGRASFGGAIQVTPSGCDFGCSKSGRKGNFKKLPPYTPDALLCAYIFVYYAHMYVHLYAHIYAHICTQEWNEYEQEKKTTEKKHLKRKRSQEEEISK